MKEKFKKNVLIIILILITHPVIISCISNTQHEIVMKNHQNNSESTEVLHERNKNLSFINKLKPGSTQKQTIQNSSRITFHNLHTLQTNNGEARFDFIIKTINEIALLEIRDNNNITVKKVELQKTKKEWQPKDNCFKYNIIANISNLPEGLNKLKVYCMDDAGYENYSSPFLAMHLSKRDVDSSSKINAVETIPAFPWPPPKASAWYIIPNSLIIKPDIINTMKDVLSRLNDSINKSGYTDKSYYSVPDGFALVTRLEQIYSNGKPIEEPNRWVAEYTPMRKFTLKGYIKALFGSPPGYYRIIVFIISTQPIRLSDKAPYRQEAIDWLTGGALFLDDNIAKKEYSKKHHCTALIYEFKQNTSHQRAFLMIPSKLTGQLHLKNAGILNY